MNDHYYDGDNDDDGRLVVVVVVRFTQLHRSIHRSGNKISMAVVYHCCSTIFFPCCCCFSYYNYYKFYGKYCSKHYNNQNLFNFGGKWQTEARPGHASQLGHFRHIISCNNHHNYKGMNCLPAVFIVVVIVVSERGRRRIHSNKIYA